MSNIRGITFAEQTVTPADDAIVRRAMLSDGILSGCAVTYSGSTLTMASGYIIACGRAFQVTAAQNWAVVDATSGFARLLLTIDLTKTATEDSFNQVAFSLEYAAAEDGFVDLLQEDINLSGSKYQIVAAVVSLGTGGITGIVSKLERTEGGGGLNFKVVPGLTQPGTASENTIWVKTQKISSWILSPSEPDNPVEGMVWILVGEPGSVEFNALKRNGIQLYPVAAEQYTNGAWMSVESHIYQAGTWTELVGALVLFDGTDGGDNTDVTGGWSVISQTTQATLDVSSEYVSFLSGSAGTVRRGGPVKAVDLSRYKTLYCDGLNGSSSDSDNYSFMLLAERTNSAVPVATVRQPFGTRGVVTIDLTAIASRDKLYFAISNASSSVGSKLFRCWADHREASAAQMQSDLQAAYQEGVNSI